jgi:hypothetical protein
VTWSISDILRLKLGRAESATNVGDPAFMQRKDARLRLAVCLLPVRLRRSGPRGILAGAGRIAGELPRPVRVDGVAPIDAIRLVPRGIPGRNPRDEMVEGSRLDFRAEENSRHDVVGSSHVSSFLKRYCGQLF